MFAGAGGNATGGVRPGAKRPTATAKSGIAKIDQWTDYVRRTGDARSTVSELAAAQAELKTSFDLFSQRQDYAGASLSAVKIATIQRLLNQ